MGRMKELYIEMLEREMQEMSTEDYLALRHQQHIMETYEEERARLQSNQQADLGKTTEDSERDPVKGKKSS